MTPETPRQVSINDLLLIVGQQTVEIVFLHKRVAELEQQLAPQSLNGAMPVEVPSPA